MTKDERELIDEKFTGLTHLINARFETIEDRLERIEGQTTKTNGRVTSLEHKELTHIQNCPVSPKIEKINEELAEYKMLKKYPKIGIGIVAAAVLMFLITTLTSIEKVKKVTTEENKEILIEMLNEFKASNDTLQIW